MIRDIKRIMRRLTPAEVAAKELADAELELLTALTHREYAQSLIDYNEARVKRLRTFLAKLEKTV
jgi:molybdopterin-guanine dinucleotide biosynthesis protein A